MKNLRNKSIRLAVVAIVAAAAIYLYRKGRAALRKRSQLGNCEGFSEASYDAYERLYFGAGPSGTVASGSDGILTRVASNFSTVSDRYILDDSTTDGENSRWSADAEHHDTRIRANYEKALTYTSRPLQTDIEISGRPVAHLWLVTDLPDLDVSVYLEEVDGQRNAAYLTEGNLRASHRALGTAPDDNLRLPDHDHYERNLKAIRPGEPFELIFDLLATSHRFQAGNRIRITVAFAGAGNFDTPIRGLNFLRSRHYPSRVELPLA